MSPDREPRSIPWWKKLLRYVAYAVGTVFLGAAGYYLLWYWPGQAGEDLPLLEDPTGELTLEHKLRRQVEVRQLEKDRVATGAQVFLGLGILVGIYLTWRRIRATERQAQTAQDQMELARRQQTAERFTQAIEQLGSGEMSIRLGGIYALEKIAHDEPGEYFNLFREVLCAFVRARAITPNLDDEWTAKPLPVDLQAALSVLGRTPPPVAVEDPACINWTGAHLEQANLRSAHLESADLSFAHLECADLTDAHLGGADLSYAQLHQANLHSAHLEHADLSFAFLKPANLMGAHLEGAKLAFARLEGANLLGAHLQGADLSLAHLEGAKHLQNAHLKAACYADDTRFPAGFEPPKDMVKVRTIVLGDPPEDVPAPSDPPTESSEDLT